MALGVEIPWSVSKAEFVSNDHNEKELHIWFSFESGFKFTAPDGSKSSSYDTIEKTWRHLNFFQHRCYLHAKVPRIKYGKNKISMVEVPWARPNSGFTLLFEAYAMLLIEEEMPVASVSALTKETAPRLWRIFSHWVVNGYEEDSWENVRHIGVDETSRRKGHQYITQFVDLETRRTLFVVEGKGADTFKAFKDELVRKGGKPDNIKIISMDMSAAFIAGYMDCFPHAQVVFDKFHLVQYLNKALDDVRKGEHASCKYLKKERFTLLRKSSKLSKEKLEKLDKIITTYPLLGEAYGLRESFMEVYSIADTEQAKGYLAFWCDMATQSSLFPFRRLALTIRAHWFGIASYFQHRGITNGILEGINSKIQLAKRRARGYANVQNFIHMIYFIAGKLNMSYPHEML